MSQEDTIDADILKFKLTLTEKFVEQVRMLLLNNNLDPCEPLTCLEIHAPPSELVNFSLFVKQADISLSLPYTLTFLNLNEFKEVLCTVMQTWQISEIRAANMNALTTMIYEPGLKSISTRIDKKGRMIIKAGKTTRYLSNQNVYRVVETGLKDAIEAKRYAIRRSDSDDLNIDTYYGERCTRQSSCNCMRCCR